MAGDPIASGIPSLAQAAVSMAPPPPLPDVILAGEGPSATCTISDEALAQTQGRALVLEAHGHGWALKMGE